MKVDSILHSLNLNLDSDREIYVKVNTRNMITLIKDRIKKLKIVGEVVVGGSFGKGTMLEGEELDVDILVRFDPDTPQISSQLSRILRPIKKNKELVHGSRDYYRIHSGENLIFEIIPVIKISHPRDAKNVIDLSYFHLNYVKRKAKGKIKREILIGKAFAKAHRVYGAESYIQGFSGYGIECMIINYGSFIEMAKAIAGLINGNRLILDPEKKFKNKKNVLLELNESKIQGPIILVDPTWKERNVLAALSYESFYKFQKSLKNFLRSPSKKYFEIKKIGLEKVRKIPPDREFIEIKLKTNKQAGDVAGAKLKKFSKFLGKEIESYFEIKKHEFDYLGGKEGVFYLLLKAKKEVVRKGPSLKMNEDIRRFKKANKETFVKNGIIHSKQKINFTGKKYLRVWVSKKNNKKRAGEMGIVEIKIN